MLTSSRGFGNMRLRGNGGVANSEKFVTFKKGRMGSSLTGRLETRHLRGGRVLASPHSGVADIGGI